MYHGPCPWSVIRDCGFKSVSPVPKTQWRLYGSFHCPCLTWLCVCLRVCVCLRLAADSPSQWFPVLGPDVKFTHAWGGAVAMTRDMGPFVWWDGEAAPRLCLV